MTGGDDATILREAARILRRRSRKPDSLTLAIMVRALEKVAERVEAASR